MRSPAWQPVLDFWFLPEEDPAHGQARPEWFGKDPAFDALIEQRFGATISRALAGEFVEWDDDPRGALARIILLDQFTRNVFRDTPKAFAGDALALAAACAMLKGGRDRILAPVERTFVYLPFEHAEDITMQERGVALFNSPCSGAGPGRQRRVCGAASRHHRALWPFSAPQSHSRAGIDSRGNRISQVAGFLFLVPATAGSFDTRDSGVLLSPLLFRINNSSHKDRFSP